MAEYKSEFDRRGVSIAVVSFAEPSKLAHYQELHRWPFTMLADPERRHPYYWASFIVSGAWANKEGK